MNLQSLVFEAVRKNYIFNGVIGSSYTVQDLLHNVSLKTLDNLYRDFSKKIDNTSQSLFDNSSLENEELVQKRDTIKEIFLYKTKLIESREILKNKMAELSKLQKMKDELSLEELKNKGVKNIEKQIEKLEKEIGV